jgi:predicted nucleic acid-binding protein
LSRKTGAKKDKAFWDSSSLLPLCCDQKYFTAASRTLIRNFPRIVVWWSTRIEVENGICRLRRTGELTLEHAAAARKKASALLSRCREVLPTDDVRTLAVEVIQQYALSTADALQLSAALIWCNRKPFGHPFVCFDQNLRNAAGEAGFQVYSFP